MTENQTLVTLLETDNQAIFSTVKSILDDGKISYVIRGEHLWRNRLLKLEVDSTDEQRARMLLKDVNVGVNTQSDPILDVVKTKWYRWVVVLAVMFFLLYQILQVINNK